jgi:hypothetical protein
MYSHNWNCSSRAYGRLCETSGELRRFINVYVDGEDIRFLNQLSTGVGPDAEVSIVPAIAAAVRAIRISVNFSRARRKGAIF